MNELKVTYAREKIGLLISWIITLLFVIGELLIYMFYREEIGLYFIFGFLILFALISVWVFSVRFKEISLMLSEPEKLFSLNYFDEDYKKNMVAHVSPRGILHENTFYTFNAYSCRLEDVTKTNIDGEMYIVFSLSMPRKNMHRSMSSISVPITDENRQAVEAVYNMLKK